MRHFKLLLALLGVSLLSACGGSNHTPGLTNPGTPPPTDSVAGTVMYKGAPLAGATVTAWDTNSNVVYKVATTGVDGTYSFSGLTTSGNAVSVYEFWANKAGLGFYPSVGGGASVVRSGHNGQFQANLAPIIFTVIQFDSLANDSISGANFTAYDGSNALVQISATGQTVSYASGDDASAGKGVAWPASRLNNNGDGSVTDKLTGLIWLKNAGCFSPASWTAALTDVNQLASGACGLTDGSKAGDWRVPNLNELESLIDVSASNPALPAGNPFTNVSTGIYWTSTSYYGGQGGSPDAWAIRMSDGRYINDSVANVKATSSNAVWAVKGSGGGAVKLQSTGESAVFNSGDDGSIQAGVGLTSPRWIDKGNGTVVDTVTGLTWLKKADCINQDWATAVGSVDSLASGQCGLTDGSVAGNWRMPNRNEMQSLSDRMMNNHAEFFDATFLNPDNTVYQAPIFTTFMPSQYYWTSTTNAANPTEAWTVYSCDFGVYDMAKISTGYTLAVR